MNKLGIAFIFLLGPSFSVFAQPGDGEKPWAGLLDEGLSEDDGPDRPKGPPPGALIPDVLPRLSVDGFSAGAAEALSVGAGVDVKFKLGRFQVLKPGVSVGRTSFELDDLGIGLEADEVWSAEAGLAFLKFSQSGWTWFSKLEVGGAAEERDELFDDPVFLGIFGAGKRVESGNEYGIGLLVKQDIEEDWRAFPVPQIKVKIAEGWRLETERGILVTQMDPAAGRPWEGPTAGWRWGVGLDYANTRFRSADGRVVEVNAAPVFGRALWNDGDGLSLEARLGAVVWGEIEVDDERGRGIADEDLDFGPTASFRVRWTF